jgi:hypothetical protein
VIFAQHHDVMRVEGLEDCGSGILRTRLDRDRLLQLGGDADTLQNGLFDRKARRLRACSLLGRFLRGRSLPSSFLTADIARATAWIQYLPGATAGCRVGGMTGCGGTRAGGRLRATTA